MTPCGGSKPPSFVNSDCQFFRWYDPLKKETNLNAPEIKKWLGNGAVPSDTVRNLLKKAYVMEPDAPKIVVPKVAV